MKNFSYVFDNTVAKRESVGKLLCFFTRKNLYKNF